MSIFGRRSFLTRTGALAAFAGSIDQLAAQQKPGARPKNIVFMVSDGMSPTVLTLAEHFSKMVRQKGTVWQALFNRPEAARGLMDMASLNSIVTDSSAASSSWGSGSRIWNAMVNTLPDGTALTPIATIAQQQKRRVGLVTTATVTHATPAGFAASERRRDDEDKIAEQYVRNVDVVLGGGRKFFDADKRKDGKDVPAAYRAAGFELVRTKEDLMKARRAAKMLGLFFDGHVPYSIDHRENADWQRDIPTLAEMTEVALESLSQSRNGFLLQVEGARIDHAAHNNDAAAMLWDQMAFDDAIATVLKFAEKNPETLIVITSDHGNSNPGMNGMGSEYGGTDACFARLAQARRSFELLTPLLGSKAEYTMAQESTSPAAKTAASRIRDVVKDSLGLELTAAQVEWVRRTLAGEKSVSLNVQHDKPAGILGLVAGNHTGIQWTGTQHTSDYTLVTAIGPGSERFRGAVRNTECFRHMAQFMGSNFRNPEMDLDTAMKFRKVAMVRRMRVDWA